MAFHFRSVPKFLTLQDGQEIDPKSGRFGDLPEPWAVFVDHVFTTDDKAVAARLRALPDIIDESTPAKGATKNDAPAD